MVLNVKPKILKPLEENIWGNLYDLEAGKILDTSKNKSHKRKKKIVEMLFEIHHLKNEKTSHGLEKHIFKTQNW